MSTRVSNEALSSSAPRESVSLQQDDDLSDSDRFLATALLQGNIGSVSQLLTSSQILVEQQDPETKSYSTSKRSSIAGSSNIQDTVRASVTKSNLQSNTSLNKSNAAITQKVVAPIIEIQSPVESRNDSNGLINQLKEENARLQGIINEKEKELSSIKQLSRQAIDEFESVKQQLIQEQTLNKKLSAELDSYEDHVQEKSSKVDGLEEYNESLKLEINALRGQIEELQNEVQGTRSGSIFRRRPSTSRNSADVGANLDGLRGKFLDEVNKIQDERDKIKDEIETLKREREQLQKSSVNEPVAPSISISASSNSLANEGEKAGARRKSALGFLKGSRSASIAVTETTLQSPIQVPIAEGGRTLSSDSLGSNSNLPRSNGKAVQGPRQEPPSPNSASLTAINESRDKPAQAANRPSGGANMDISSLTSLGEIQSSNQNKKSKWASGWKPDIGKLMKKNSQESGIRGKLNASQIQLVSGSFQGNAPSSSAIQAGAHNIGTSVQPGVANAPNTPAAVEVYQSNTGQKIDVHNAEILSSQNLVKSQIALSSLPTVYIAATEEDASSDLLKPSEAIDQILNKSIDASQIVVTTNGYSHRLVPASYMSPKKCEVCNEKLWGKEAKCENCNFHCHNKCSTQIAKSCTVPLDKSDTKIFGVSLSTTFEKNDNKIPQLITECMKAVDARGMEFEGIYRKSGPMTQINRIIANANKGEVADMTSDETFDIMAITSVLKQYLRELPDALLVGAFYKEWLDSARLYSAVEQDENDPNFIRRVDATRELINKLPLQNRVVLALLMVHFNKVSTFSNVNLMYPSNIGVVLGPTLLKPASNNGDGSFTQQQSVLDVADSGLKCSVIEFLVRNVNILFSSRNVYGSVGERALLELGAPDRYSQIEREERRKRELEEKEAFLQETSLHELDEVEEHQNEEEQNEEELSQAEHNEEETGAVHNQHDIEQAEEGESSMEQDIENETQNFVQHIIEDEQTIADEQYVTQSSHYLSNEQEQIPESENIGSRSSISGKSVGSSFNNQ